MTEVCQSQRAPRPLQRHVKSCLSLLEGWPQNIGFAATQLYQGGNVAQQMVMVCNSLLHMQVEVRLRVIHYSKQMLGTCAHASTAKVNGVNVPSILLT